MTKWRDPQGFVAGVAAGVAVTLGAATRARKTRRMDHAVRRAVQPKQNPRIVVVAKGISYLASPKIHPLIALAACAGISATKRRLTVAPLIASIFAAGVDKSAKYLVAQRRPPKSTRHKGRDRFAFPSGHASATTAIAVATAIELAEGRRRREQVLLYALAGAAAAAVGWSRLQLDEHWFDDVAGGWATGIAIAIGSAAMCSERPLHRRSI